MNAPNHSPLPDALRRLLAVCDTVGERRDAIDGAYDRGDRRDLLAARTAHRRAAKRALTALDRALAGGTLAPVLPDSIGDAGEAFVALRLLSSRVTTGSGGTDGRRLLSELYQSPVDMLRHTRMLEPEAPLRRCGVVVGTDEDDPFEREYRFGDARYADVCRLVGGARRPVIEPYTDGADHLADWHRLAQLYRQRATLEFGEELMEQLAVFGAETRADADFALDVQRERMVARLMATAQRRVLPTLEFQRHYGLGELEMVIATTVCYHPVLAGVDATPIALCAKMVAARESDLLQAAALLAPGGALRRHGLLVVDDHTEGPGAVRLSPHAEAELLADHRRALGIRRGERSAFRRYLETLDGSGPFFHDLGLGGPSGRGAGREETPPAA